MSPGQVDTAVVRRHLVALDDTLQTLREHQGRDIEVLRADRSELWVVQHGLQLCSQNVLDVATHIVASAGRDVPDYTSAIDRLADLRILPRDFVRRFRGIAGFRNIVVHGYLEVDIAVVHRLLNQSLEDFVQFARYVNDHLASLEERR
jgi:uncharacterized protein YutE (UPF0331/DUF86 family)